MGAWMIRAGRGGIYAEEWLELGIVGINWDFDAADISKMTHEAIRRYYKKLHPDESGPKVAAAVGQVNRFAHELIQGETVVMYSPQSRLYHIGQISSDCVPVVDIDGMTYKRGVIWNLEAPRDLLSTSSKNSLGAISTIFSISDEVMGDLQSAANKHPTHALPVSTDETPEDENDEDARYATYDDGIERIKDRVLALDWDSMQQLTAGLLRSIGYHARVSQKGPDGGRDIVASPDVLGLESPHIVVEVKHRKGAMGAPQIRSFIGGLRASDRGLYVSTGGFTKEAKYEADRSNVPVRLLNLDEFVRLYIEMYDQADEDTRSILPLVRIWWPA